MSKKPFAVFVVCPFSGHNGEIILAVTTRDGADAGRIGLPGGKVDSTDASPIAAAVREAAEEGWDCYVPAGSEPIHEAIVDGREVWWFAGFNASRPLTYKEQARGIVPGLAPLSAVTESGYGNEWLAGAERALAYHADNNTYEGGAM